MIRRIVEEEKKYRKLNHRSVPKHPLEACMLLLPLVFVSFGLILMYIALRYQINYPMDCVSLSEISVCSPNSVVIAVVTTDPSYKQAHVAASTWVPIARGLGMKVVFFGKYRNPDLPVVDISGNTPTEQSINIWKWLNYHYSSSNSWFMKVYDDTFVHPYFLMKNVLCHYDSRIDWYIGEKGSSFHVRSMSFAGGSAGYVLSLSSLQSLIQAWEDGTCRETVAEDVSVAKCMQYHLNIPLTSHAQFIPKFAHNYFRPWSEFITYGKAEGSVARIIEERSLRHCNYLQSPNIFSN